MYIHYTGIKFTAMVVITYVLGELNITQLDLYVSLYLRLWKIFFLFLTLSCMGDFTNQWMGAYIAPPHNLYRKLYKTVSLYTHSLPLIFCCWKKCSVLRVLGRKKASKLDLQKFKTKISIFEYFPKISS